MEEHIASISRVAYFPLKMEATFSPENFVPTYEATRRYESENHSISEQLRIAFRNSQMICCVSVKFYTDSVYTSARCIALYYLCV